jgi:hypothetical protein
VIIVRVGLKVEVLKADEEKILDRKDGLSLYLTTAWLAIEQTTTSQANPSALALPQDNPSGRVARFIDDPVTPRESLSTVK